MKVRIGPSLVILAAFIFSKCANPSIDKPKTTNTLLPTLFSPYSIGSILESPWEHEFVFDANEVRTQRIKTLRFYVKGANVKRNILAKSVYQFDQEGKTRNFIAFNYKKSNSPLTELEYNYSNYRLSQLLPLNANGMGAQPPILFQYSDYSTTRVAIFGSANADTTWFEPSAGNPKTIIHKSNGFLEYIELMQEGEYNAGKYIEKLLKMDSLSAFELADKRVTIWKNNLPLKTYILNDKFEKERTIREWVYDDKQRLIEYTEFVMNNPTRKLELSYRSDGYLNYIIQNKQKFLAHYTFFHAQ